MIANSKKILLWGIKIIVERYFNEPFKEKIDTGFIRNIQKLISVDNEFVTEDYQIGTDTRHALRSVFTQTGFCTGEPGLDPDNKLYHKPTQGLSSDDIVPGNKAEFQTNDYFKEGKSELTSCTEKTQPERLINLLFKYGANVPIFDEKDCVMPLYEYVKVMAALATNPEGKYRLLLGDLSGIQNFIYTIDSRGALKILRSRSFYLELLTKSIAHEICENLDLSSANVLYSGGGNFLLLLPDNEDLKLDDKIDSYYEAVNTFFLDNFQGNIHLAMADVRINSGDFSNIKAKWKELHTNLDGQKKRKFKGILQKYSEPTEADLRECQICHADEKGKTILKEKEIGLTCVFCNTLFEFGKKLITLNEISANPAKSNKYAELIVPSIKKDQVWYFSESSDKTSRRFRINQIPDDDAFMMFYCNYVTMKDDQSGDIADFEDLADKTIGADLIGTLAMDVDNMGKVFSHGIITDANESDYLILVPTLSRNLDYFFKYALKHICEKPEFQACDKIGNFQTKPKRDVSVIYSGGDDLLLTGAWNDVVEVAYDIHENFESFTCKNSDMGLSGGIYISQPKFPFYISVQKAQEAEKKAKGNSVEAQNGELAGRNYKHSIIYNQPEAKINLKDSIYLFYDDTLDFQIDLIDETSDLKNRFVRALKWKEVKDQIKADLLKFLKPDLCKFQPSEKNIAFEFPRSFITKLYDMVHKFRTLDPGILYLPDLVYHYSRLDSVQRKRLKEIFDNYNRYDLKKQDNEIFYLPVILTWIELLIRQKGEK